MAQTNAAYNFEPAKKVKETKKPEFKVIKNKNLKKVKARKANKASLIVSTLLVFAMLVIVNYRYNLISEKNLTVQKLQMLETEAAALLTNAEIEYSKTVDIVEVEAYAKQQLGMQEPEKSQMVYVGSNYDGKMISSSKNNTSSSVVDKIIQKINEIF